MQLSRKRTYMEDHLSSSSSNHQTQQQRPRQAIQTPDRKFLEEQLHLLQYMQVYRSPSVETDMETNSVTSPLLCRQPRPWLPLPRGADRSLGMGSLLECCPMSPSPVCSPTISHVSNAGSRVGSHVSNVHSHSSNVCSHMSNVNTDDAVFATAKSSYHIEADTGRSTSSDEIQEEETTIRPPESTFSQPQVQTRSRVQTPYRHSLDMQNRRAGLFGNRGISHWTVPGRHIIHRHNVQAHGLPEERTYSRQLHWPLTTVSSQRPSVDAWNRGSVEGSYMADDENSLASRPRQLGRTTLAGLRGGQMEAKLKALKEEHEIKLLTRLRQQEDAIDNWEREQILKVKKKMRKTEIKLELERRTALKKARNDIEKTQRKAEKRKIQEQNETAKKIACSNKAVEKISFVGKVLWKLACF